ncbi:hypothetical protein Tco_0170527 [Tanacetum coccineum]
MNHNNGRGDGVTDGACMMVAGIEAKGPLPTPLLKIEVTKQISHMHVSLPTKFCCHRKRSRKRDTCSFGTQTSQWSPKDSETWRRGGKKVHSCYRQKSMHVTGTRHVTGMRHVKLKKSRCRGVKGLICLRT